MSYRERLLGEVVRIDEEYQREQHACLCHEEELESHLAACLGYYRCPLPLRAEEVLELPFQEMSIIQILKGYSMIKLVLSKIQPEMSLVSEDR